MRILHVVPALALAISAAAEEPVELKWKIEKGDRFGLEISMETTREHKEAEGNYDVKETFRVFATMDVVEAEGGEAKVEIRIHRTDGKRRESDAGFVEDVNLGTEAQDWKDPIKATLTGRGSLDFDAKSLMDALADKEVPILAALTALFPLLPEAAVQAKEPWPGAAAAMAESWQLASVKKASGVETATLVGEAKAEGKEPVEDGKKEATRTHRGAMTAEFDLTAGFLKSTQSRFTMEVRVPGKGKPRDAATATRTATLKKLPREKK